MRFRRFVILGAMRTGSNLLEDLLGQLDGVVCHGELFNPHFIGKRDREAYLGCDLAARDADPLGLLAAMEAEAAGRLPGFRLFHDHDPRVIDQVLADPATAKIVLTRNPLESWVSLRIAAATDQWRLTNMRHHRAARIRFEPEAFAAHLQAQQNWQRRILHALQTGGQAAFYIHYEDLGDVAVLNGLAAFLGVAARLEGADSRLKPQNPEPVVDKVENPEEMAAALAALDRFDLARTPNFEPRRGAGVPGFRAADRAGLLFLPLRGGPEAAVLDWMAAVEGCAPDALTGGFNHRSLAEWMRARPGHRAFAVLRHPLARGWLAFRDAIVPGRFPRICNALRRNHGLTLPPGGGDAAVLRADFLGFLGFVKANLAGQTAVRVDPLWASQGALLRGMAQVRMPDALLREESAAEGLAALLPAGKAGGAAPAPFMPEGFADLVALHGPDLEAAARAAWPGDYSEFGCRDWR